MRVFVGPVTRFSAAMYMVHRKFEVVYRQHFFGITSKVMEEVKSPISELSRHFLLCRTVTCIPRLLIRYLEVSISVVEQGCVPWTSSY